MDQGVGAVNHVEQIFPILAATRRSTLALKSFYRFIMEDIYGSTEELLWIQG
jgi:hypothetical protein